VDLVRLVFWSFGASVGGWRLAVSTLGALEVSECSFGVLVAGWIAAVGALERRGIDRRLEVASV
jgi:hypothetical protein